MGTTDIVILVVFVLVAWGFSLGVVYCKARREAREDWELNTVRFSGLKYSNCVFTDHGIQYVQHSGPIISNRFHLFLPHPIKLADFVETVEFAEGFGWSEVEIWASPSAEQELESLKKQKAEILDSIKELESPTVKRGKVKGDRGEKDS